jgi:hypothetical protein
MANLPDLPSGIDRSGCDLGPPRPYQSFTVEALIALGAKGLYRGE